MRTILFFMLVSMTFPSTSPVNAAEEQLKEQKEANRISRDIIRAIEKQAIGCAK